MRHGQAWAALGTASPSVRVAPAWFCSPQLQFGFFTSKSQNDSSLPVIRAWVKHNQCPPTKPEALGFLAPPGRPVRTPLTLSPHASLPSSREREEEEWSRSEGSWPSLWQAEILSPNLPNICYPSAAGQSTGQLPRDRALLNVNKKSQKLASFWVRSKSTCFFFNNMVASFRDFLTSFFATTHPSLPAHHRLRGHH